MLSTSVSSFVHLLNKTATARKKTRNQKHHLENNAIPTGYSHPHMLLYVSGVSAAQCIVIGPVCVAGGRAGGVRTLLQPARAQCLRLSERFLGSTP